MKEDIEDTPGKDHLTSMSSSSSIHTQDTTRGRNRKEKDHLSIPTGSEGAHSTSSYSQTYSQQSSGAKLLSSLHPNNNNNYATLSIPHYLQRMVDVQQMDIQSAFDQMVTLCSLHPQRVYKTSYYRKQTKNHWARDDPAFAVLQILFLLLSSIAYCIAFREHLSIGGILNFASRNILINWAGSGFLVATVGRVLANGYLTIHNQGNGNSLHVKQSVEWLYAFDIHCNAFFPFFVLLYGIQFFLLPLVLGNSLFSFILSNTLYAIAFSWYFYITHLGYRALPFLSNTEVFLFPIIAVLAIYILNFVGYPLGLGWNASRLVAHFYFD